MWRNDNLKQIPDVLNENMLITYQNVFLINKFIILFIIQTMIVTRPGYNH